MIENDGKWHDILNQLRKRFQHYMDGEISQQQRDLGLDYGINFGVSLMHLREIAKDLPHDSSLSDIMWQKDVREMKILSVLIYPTSELTHAKALSLCKECPTREIAEQLVIVQFRNIAQAEKLLLEIFQLNLPEEHPASIIPYLLLNQLANKESVSVETINKLLTTIGNDLTKSDFTFLTALNNCVNRLAEVSKLRPALIHIATEALSSLSEKDKGYIIALNLKEYLLEL